MGRVNLSLSEAVTIKDQLAAEYWARNYAVLLSIVRQEEPVDTGELRALTSIDKPRKIPNGYLIRVRTKAGHGIFVHEGHGVIRPRRAKALRFVTKSGAVVFAQKVRPVAAVPFYYTAFKRAGYKKVRRLKI